MIASKVRKMIISFGDSDFCDRYRGTGGLLGRLVRIIDRLWLKEMQAKLKSEWVVEVKRNVVGKVEK